MPRPKLNLGPDTTREIQLALAGQRPLPASFRTFDRAALARAAGVELLPSAKSIAESAQESPPRPPAISGEEALIRLYDRPSLLIQGGRIGTPESDLWKRNLSIFRPVIEPQLASVGRINLYNSDDYDWVGTGWMVTETIAVTNRHVARLFTAVAADGTYKPIRGYFTRQDVQARIDFGAELGGPAAPGFEVARVLYISPDGDANPDIALLQMKADGALPPPLQLGDDPAEGSWVGVVGYPARDSARNSADAQASIFGDTFDVKRFAPGKVMPGGDGFVFQHDASTLGGNSGSAVLSLATGKLAGLHFGGRFMISNYAVKSSAIQQVLKAQSVQVSVLAALSDNTQESIEEARRRDDPTHPASFFDGREGYRTDFLGAGFDVPWPSLASWKDDLVPLTTPVGDNENRLDYTHFSVILCRSRRMALVTAVNVDGAQSISIDRASADNTWFFDGRVDRKYQLGNLDAYDHNKLDKGHQVRREDPNWGTDEESKLANLDTFHYTNSCPQHANLNQRTWLALESFLLDTAKARGLKLTVFTGPVLREDDFAYRQIQVPAEFFKVAVVVDEETGKLEATGYLESQTDYLGDIDESVLNGGSTYQVPITHLEQITKLDFGSLRDFDPLSTPTETTQFRGHRVRRPEDIRHR